MNAQSSDGLMYYKVHRPIVIELLSQIDGISMLELGCGLGRGFQGYLDSGVKKVTGVDLVIDEEQRRRLMNADERIEVYGNPVELFIDKNSLYNFDAVVASHLLEHLENPEALLESLFRKTQDNCELVIVLPNVRHIRAFLSIFIKGTFPKNDSGIFDRTHRWFYCKRDMYSLFESSGYQVRQVIPEVGKGLPALVNSLTFRLFEEFIASGYGFSLTKNRSNLKKNFTE